MTLRAIALRLPLVALVLVGACSSSDPQTPIPSTSPSLADASHPLDRAMAGNTAAIELHLTNLGNLETAGYRALVPLWTGPNEFEVTLNPTQGGLRITNRPLDLAMEGPGLFRLRRPDSTSDKDPFAYTRGGALFISPSGELVFSNSGAPLDPPIKVPRGVTEKDVSVALDGVVTVRVSGQKHPQRLGQILIFDFPNPARLRPLEDLTLYAPTAASGPARQAGTPSFTNIRNGSLEVANVEAPIEQLAIERLKDWRHVLLARYRR